ncbi:hypothetical protein SAMN04487980_1004304 [Streptomyces sp. cf124]|uniref:hypothetical protein n=1 Tax=unclassified Streptomyces TaxID=2593676 RepID=UPI0005EE678F|nr:MULTISPECIES: hypothetical protein [unclassified Streptomyces]SFM71995.1 hypothetical protein SAMN04487980_1004304 [Streptomyces sp. cf124]
MTDDVTKGESIRERGPRNTREADARRDGTRASAIPPGTRAADATGDAKGGTGTGAPLVAGHDTTEGHTGGRTEHRTMGGRDEPGRGRGEDPARATDGAGSRSAGGAGSSLLPHDESDKLTLRMQHAVGGFVDGPRSAVEEADHVLEEVTARFTDAMTQRRRTLRTSWETTGDDRATATDTEQLRLALRDYRELTERLLRL